MAAAKLSSYSSQAVQFQLRIGDEMQQAQGAQPTASTANTLLWRPEPSEAWWNQQKIIISPEEDKVL